MASSVKIDIKRINQKLEKAILLISTKSEMQALGKFTAEMIVKRTRLGYGVDKYEAPKRKLPGLSKSYKKARGLSHTKLGRKLNTGLTRPGKSNLTLTGQMLDFIRYRASKNKVSIFPSGKRAENKAQWAEEGSSNRPERPFLHLSDIEATKIDQYLGRRLRLALRVLR